MTSALPGTGRGLMPHVDTTPIRTLIQELRLAVLRLWFRPLPANRPSFASHHGTTLALGGFKVRKRIAILRTRLERLLLWRVWERMLEVEFVDRSVAIAGKAFVSFFPLVIVVAALAPERIRSSIISTVTARLGIQGDALTLAREAFASSDDIRKATGLLGLVLTILYASSFTTALQRLYLRGWRRSPGTGVGAQWRGAAWLLVILAYLALLGGLRAALGNGLGLGLFVIASLAVTTGLWWFTAWFLLLGEIRARVLLPTGLITSVALTGFAMSATIWMPGVVTQNEAQFGFVGVALALVTWFSGAAICILVGACAGSVFAEDPGRVGRFIRGGERTTLTAGARPPLPPPVRERSLRDAFRSNEDS
jgi:membrane protein